MFEISQANLDIDGPTSYIAGYRQQEIAMSDESTVVAEILRLRSEGLGIAKIGRALNKGNRFVSEVLKGNNAYGKSYYMSAEEKGAIRKMRLEGLSHEVIADSLGRSKAAVIEQLKKLKLNDRVIRPITIRGDIAEIALTRGKVAIIDAADLPLVQGRSWFTNGVASHPYAATRENGKPYTLHRYLMNAPADKVVDHINGDTLDNRRSNLRMASPRENAANSRRAPNASGAIGVIVTSSGKFYAAVQVGLGTFDTLEQAARAYDAKAIELFGDFAMTNAKKGLFDKDPI